MTGRYFLRHRRYTGSTNKIVWASSIRLRKDKRQFFFDIFYFFFIFYGRSLNKKSSIFEHRQHKICFLPFKISFICSTSLYNRIQNHEHKINPITNDINVKANETDHSRLGRRPSFVAKDSEVSSSNLLRLGHLGPVTFLEKKGLFLKKR